MIPASIRFNANTPWTLGALLTLSLLGVAGCEAGLPVEPTTAAPEAPTLLGACAPDPTAAACEAGCARLAGCSLAGVYEADLRACTGRCVEEIFSESAPALARVQCLAAAGDACCEVEACTLPVEASASTVPIVEEPSLPYSEGTTEYCEQAANHLFICEAFEHSPWSPESFTDRCQTWGSSMQRHKAYCTNKHAGNCSRVLACTHIPKK